MNAKLIALSVAVAFGAGWLANGWRLHATISDMKRADAEAVSQVSQVALSDFQLVAKSINASAGGAQVDLTSINAKLAQIQRNQKNAPPAPLPPDCRPGPVRLRNLSETAAAADHAIARPTPSR